jgi:hypothetical protein
MNKSKHGGSDLRDFLRDERVLEEVEARAVKRALALTRRSRNQEILVNRVA